MGYVNKTYLSTQFKNFADKIAKVFSKIGHTHLKSDITDFPTSMPANGGNAATVGGHTVGVNVPSNAKFTDTTYGVATSSALGLVKSGTDITVDSSGNVSVNDDSHNHVISNVDGLQTALDGKAASSHTHTKSQITDFPTSLPASDVYAWAKASTKPSYSKSEVGLGNVDNTADSAKSVKYATSSGSASSASKATGVVDYGATTKTIQIGYSGNGISGDEIKFIAGYTTGNGSDVNAKIKDVSKDALKSWLGLGSLAYSSATIPTIPSSLPANGGTATSSNYVNVNNTEAKIVGRLQYFQKRGDDTIMPSKDWWSLIRCQHPGYENGYWQDIAFPFYGGGRPQVRQNVNGTKSAWKELAYTSDVPSSLPANGGNSSTVNGHTVNSDVPSGAKFTDTNTWRPLGTTADTACAGNDSRLSNARPASDVSTWAKASTKPTYTASEVGAVPISGGTVNGAITFGKNDAYGIRTNTNNFGRVGDATNQFYEGYFYEIYENKTSLSNKYLRLTGDSKDNIVTFTSNDSITGDSTAPPVVITSGETHASLFNKLSTAVKNVRWLLSKMGTTDISTLGDGTVTGALSTLNSNISGKQNALDSPLFYRGTIKNDMNLYNTRLYNGYYYITNTPANAPTSINVSYAIVLVLFAYNDFGVQIIIKPSNNTFLLRERSGATPKWSTWKKITMVDI